MSDVDARRLRVAPRALLLIVLGVTAAIWLLSLSQPLRQLEAWSVDLRQKLFAPPSPARDQIVLVAIDEVALASLPYRSPVDRAFMARLVRTIAAADPLAIGIDVLFDQSTEPEHDRELQQALHRIEAPVVVAYGDRRNGLTPEQAAYLDAFSERLLRGHAVLEADTLDGRVRRARAQIDVGASTLAGALAASTGLDGMARPFLLAPVKAPTGGTPFRTLPAMLVLERPEAVATWLEDRIVLIGAVLPGDDRHYLAGASGSPLVPGVEIHAHALARMVDGWQPREAPAWVRPLLILLASGCAALIVATQSSDVRRAALLVGLVVLIQGIVFGLVTFEIVAPATAPMHAIFVTTAMVRFRIADDDRRRRRFLHQAFGKYVAPALVERLVSNPEELQLSGERRIVTALHTDLEGFTALTGELEPEAMVGLLNAYLDGICQIVVKWGGTLDKMVGDAVLALFNAPLEQADHCARAVRCGLEIHSFAKTFAAEQTERLGRRIGGTRVGIATGSVIVGNFGGDVFLDYTAIGPAMNLAARLEAANRDLGTSICVDQRTAEAASGIDFHSFGTVTAKGFAEPVAVFTPTTLEEPS